MEWHSSVSGLRPSSSGGRLGYGGSTQNGISPSPAAEQLRERRTEADTAISDAALATAANLATVAGYIDTEVAAIKSQTDKLTFNGSNVNANVEQINTVTITGDGQVGTEFGV